MKTVAARALRSLCIVRRDERGVTLIEAIAALILFAIVAAALIGLLTSSISANTFSREKTAGEQIANDQVEWIRSKGYDEVGTVSGNPPGVIAATGLKCPTPVATCDANPVVYRGVSANVTTSIQYVNDPAPTSYATQANYKKVTVTVTRSDDGSQLAQGVTYVAPPSRAPLGGLNNAVINATVVDYGSQALPPVGDVTVNLSSTSPLAARSDTTSQTGTVSFAALTPNPTSTDFYELTLTPPTGFVVLKDDDLAQTPTAAAARVSLAPGQTWNTTMRIYRPSTIYVNLADSKSTTVTTDDTPYTGPATVQISGTPGTGTFTCPGSSPSVYACSGGQLTVWQIQGEPVKPGDYEVSTTGGFLSTPVSQYVPTSYPTDLTATYTVPLTLLGGVAVTVRANGVTPVAGATVEIADGPQAPFSRTAVTNASGVATFADVPAGSGYTVTATKGSSAASVTTSVIADTTTNVDINLPLGTIPVTVRWGPGGPVVPNADVTVTGPFGYNETLQTDASGQASFADVPAGPGYDVSATKAGFTGGPVATTAVSPGTNVDVPLPATGTISVTTTWGGQFAANAQVEIAGGPDGQTYTGTTNASGVATLSVPPTASAAYTVRARKPAGSGTWVSASNVTSLGSGATVSRSIALTPTRAVRFTIRHNSPLAAVPSGTAITLSLTGGPNGTPGSPPTYTVAGTADSSGRVTITVPSGTTSYTVRGYKSGCAAGSFRSGTKSFTVTAGSGTLNGGNLDLTAAACPGPLP
jgi:type II secretory pathway pseudopilin PulG